MIFVDHLITIILLYRSPNSFETAFLDMINQLLILSKVRLILRDFNIDGLVVMLLKCQKLGHILRTYEMIVLEPTHLDGPALNHVYLIKHFLDNKKVHCSVKNLYFLDHDAVRFKID